MEIINVAPFTMVDTVTAGSTEEDRTLDQNIFSSYEVFWVKMKKPTACLTQQLLKGASLSSPVSREGLQAEEEEAAEEGEEGAGGGEKEKKKGPPLPGAAPVLPPPDAELYLVLGRLFKLHPDFDLAIIEILKGHANAHVVLIAEKHNNQITSLLWHRIKRNNFLLFHKLVFVHHWNYVAALRRAAAVLDTYPYGGCLTSLEALSHLRPLVTLPSAHVKGRFTLAMYKQVG
ncbi:unnamed protein product, partial [Heterosigma akashiwo]